MTVYTYSETRPKLAELLDTAAQGIEVTIKRHDGQMFVLRSIASTRSALDVGSIDVSVSKEDILAAIRDSRMCFGEAEPIAYTTPKTKRAPRSNLRKNR